MTRPVKGREWTGHSVELGAGLADQADPWGLEGLWAQGRHAGPVPTAVRVIVGSIAGLSEPPGS